MNGSVPTNSEDYLENLGPLNTPDMSRGQAYALLLAVQIAAPDRKQVSRFDRSIVSMPLHGWGQTSQSSEVVLKKRQGAPHSQQSARCILLIITSTVALPHPALRSVLTFLFYRSRLVLRSHLINQPLTTFHEVSYYSSVLLIFI